MELFAALQTIGNTFLELCWRCLLMTVQSIEHALEGLIACCLFTVYLGCIYVLSSRSLDLVIRFLKLLYYKAGTFYDTIFPLSTNAQVKEIRSEQQDLIHRNACLEAELQRSLEDLEDMRSNQASSSHANDLLNAELSFRKGTVEDVDGHSECLSQENVRLSGDHDECNEQIWQLIHNQEILQRNEKALDNHATHLQEKLDRQLEETLYAKSRVEQLEVALEKKEKFALTIAEFVQNERRTMEASVERMSRFKTMIESSFLGDQEASHDVSGFSSEEEE